MSKKSDAKSQAKKGDKKSTAKQAKPAAVAKAEQIADAMECVVSTGYKYVKEGLSRVVRDSAEEVRDRVQLADDVDIP